MCEYESVYKEGLSFSCCLFFFSLSCNLLFILRIHYLSSSSSPAFVSRIWRDRLLGAAAGAVITTAGLWIVAVSAATIC